jgi:ribonuclease E
VSDPSYSPNFDETGPFFPPEGEDTNARTSPSVASDPNVEPALISEVDDEAFLTSDPADDDWDDVAGVNDGLIGEDELDEDEEEDDLDDLDDDELEEILDYSDSDEDEIDVDDLDVGDLDDDDDGEESDDDDPDDTNSQGLSDTQPL